MTHASRATLVAYADGELTGAEEQQTAHHLEECAECAAELAVTVDSRARFVWAIARMDAAEPLAWDTADFADRAFAAGMEDSGGPVFERTIDLDAHRTRAWMPAPSAARTPRVRQTALRWAAGLALLAGAAAAAIVTPVIVERVFTEPAAPVGSTGQSEPASSGALAVLPVDGSITIALTGAVEGTRIRIAFEPRQDVIVDYSATEAPGFTARDGEIDVELVGAGTTLTVSVPADVREARVLVDGVVAALLARGEVVRTRPDLNVTIEVTNTGR